MQGITRHSCQEEEMEKEDKLINHALVGISYHMDTELLFLHSTAIHQYFERRGGTGRLNFVLKIAKSHYFFSS